MSSPPEGDIDLLRLDNDAVRLIVEAVRMIDGKGEEDFTERVILTMVRAAGWLIGFAALYPCDKANIASMIENHVEALRNAAEDPLRGEAGAALTRLVEAGTASQRALLDRAARAARRPAEVVPIRGGAKGRDDAP